MWDMRRLVLASFVLAAVCVLGACSYSHDAWFANPCGHALRIKTLYVVRDGTASKPSDQVIASAVLRPVAVTEVDEAFQDANGFAWFVQVAGRPTLRVEKRQMPRWLVALPASVCRGA
jgi:hypothetical protein